MDMEVVENIIKSPLDDREYRYSSPLTYRLLCLSVDHCTLSRYIKLPNGLKALLISDATTEKASAAVSVRIGTLRRVNPQGLRMGGRVGK